MLEHTGLAKCVSGLEIHRNATKNHEYYPKWVNKKGFVWFTRVLSVFFKNNDQHIKVIEDVQAIFYAAGLFLKQKRSRRLKINVDFSDYTHAAINYHIRRSYHRYEIHETPLYADRALLFLSMCKTYLCFVSSFSCSAASLNQLLLKIAI